MTVFVLLTAFPIGVLWHQSSEKVVLQTIERLYQHSSKAVKNQLDGFFEEANHVYLHQERYAEQLPEIIKHREQLFSHIAHILNHHSSIDYFYFANPQGGIISFGSDTEGNFIRIESNNGVAGPLSSFVTDYQGLNSNQIGHNDYFNATERGWYQNAIAADKPVWSKIYKGAIDQSLLGASLSKALRDEDGNILGVWGLDLTLDSVISRLKKNKLSENGFVAILNDSETILASSDSKHHAIDGQLQTVSEQRTPVLYQLVNNTRQTQESVQTTRYENEDWVGFVTHYPIGSANRYQLSLVFYSPLSDFSPALENANNSAFALTLIMVLFALYFGKLSTLHILSPIQQLTKTAKRISHGKKQKIIKIEREDELGELATSFNQMTSNLASTINKLEQEQQETIRLNALLEAQNSKLEEQVKRRTIALTEANEKLKALAYIDSLTGISNRGYFWEQLEAESARRNGWLLILDLDNFKTINDKYGHLIGDEVLKHFTQLCQQVLKPNTLIGRVGGEEFAIWCTKASKNDITQIASNLFALLKRSPLEHEGLSITISTSIGASYCCGNPEKAYAAADKLLYQAKHSGKSQIVLESLAHEGQ
ncbi:diguanylate cyclase [Photobacterium sanctipauli]|uniref:diguanylate cyclase n=1 Tax=Photobacterium sanctipauli TaxID=1342794 RepID=UPI001362B472|nr:diguanylate cyclase [Photobacterium sanctipauli]